MIPDDELLRHEPDLAEMEKITVVVDEDNKRAGQSGGP